MRVFLSHSSRDAAVAEEICEQLEKNGMQCFIAPRDIRPGKEYAEEIINGIDESAAMILLMSQNANSSPHVLREVEHAVSSNTPILVYKMEEVSLSKSMEYFLMTHQWVSAKSREDYADIVAFARDLAEEKNGERNTAADSGDDTASKDKKFSAGQRAGIFATAVAAVLAIAVIAGFAMRKPAAQESAAEPVSVQTGDTVLFGSYLDQDIQWRVLHISEDETQAVLIAAHVLTMKAYDAAESGRYNYDGDRDYWTGKSEVDADLELQIRVRGNSDWSTSNLRAWLNADTEVVTYTGQPPVASAMAEKKNGYQNEAGFLWGFTQEERDAIVETELVTRGNALSETDSVITHDRVWLLSQEELAWFDQVGIRKFATPTEAAVEQDQSYWYSLDLDTYGVECSSWWLREPVAEASSLCYLVDNGYTENVIRQENAGLEGFGVRPALTVDLRRVTFRGAESGE